ncbi:MAG: SIMPL domain-containing protein [Pyrinomonadaceae bacterium]
MKKAFLILGLLFFVNSICPAQESGNRIYGYQQNKRQPTVNSGSLLSNNQFFIEASVLLNIKPDSFVAVFGVAEEAKDAVESSTKVDQRIDAFIKGMNGLGITGNDVFVDFISQNRVYDFQVSADAAQEYLAGFETKKTVAVKYKSRDSFEKILAAATNSGIFDLIKVDYIVSDFEPVRARLFEEAAKIIKQKETRYRNAFDMTLKSVGPTVEKYDAFYPAERYENYKAFEAGAARTTNYRDGKTFVYLRKSTTFFYEPLDGKSFDKMINPVGIEPTVQFTIYLQVKYNLI